MLRSRARKSGTQTSGYRGVSMLKQTGKWHAQINVGGKQARARAAPPAPACSTGSAACAGFAPPLGAWRRLWRIPFCVRFL